MENENLVYLINKRDEIIEEIKFLEKNSILIGLNPKYDKDALYEDTLSPRYVERQYKKNNDLLKEIIALIETKNIDINTDDYVLKRSDLINFINNKFNYKTDDISKLTSNVLHEIIEELKRHIYTYDHNFYSFGLRNTLEIECKQHIEKNEILQAFTKLFTYITGENNITISDIPDELVRKAEETRPAMLNSFIDENTKNLIRSLSPSELALYIVEQSDEKYKVEGIICEDEKERILSMLSLIKKNLGDKFLEELIN